MREENAFLDAIRNNPDDDITRLVFADWLDERGDELSATKSAYLRLECQLAEAAEASDENAKLRTQLHQYAQNLPGNWLVIVSKVGIENCPSRLASKCPTCWDRLLPATDSALRFGDEISVRFCDMCKENIYYCTNITQAKGHMLSGARVALDPRIPRKVGDLGQLRRTGGLHPGPF